MWRNTRKGEIERIEMNAYERIKVLCAERKISIRKLEADLGLARGNAYKWQQFTPNAATVSKLADYFGVSPAYLLYGDEIGSEADVKDTVVSLIYSLNHSDVIMYGGRPATHTMRRFMAWVLERLLEAVGEIEKDTKLKD